MPEVERDHRRCLSGRSMAVLNLKLKEIPVESLRALEKLHVRLLQLIERFEREVNLNENELTE